ncbi:hypothetical protein TrLO_g2783 [Triparma laevis f. longispina]|uniref:Uncharacterized protein n=1 Tax=Triparma laevis f. longispina TaxID=1714387 RepID=A0A9W7L118_9STRA|nr:hypothetical protein TrLO_g2783 [Triparma laevis f. longispina]
MKGVFVGSGSEGMQSPTTSTEILRLTGKSPSSVNVAYLGTSSYDLSQFKINQVSRLQEAGCTITSLRVTFPGDCTKEDMTEIVRNADVLIVAGGNTLFSTNRWRSIGLDSLLKEAADRGCVMCGGSAGAICWFDAGHSDSADPDTYYEPMMKEFGDGAESKEESSALGEVVKPWKYVRVSCLGFLPGLCLPHADKVQSNGVLRMDDFDEMMLRHPGERGITIDHFCALVVNGDDYRVVGLEGKGGSVMSDGSFNSKQEGRPGCWVKNVVGGKVVTELLPWEGKLSDVLKPADEIVEDPNCAQSMQDNPHKTEM